jgi:hypothetical protein
MAKDLRCPIPLSGTSSFFGLRGSLAGALALVWVLALVLGVGFMLGLKM